MDTVSEILKLTMAISRTRSAGAKFREKECPQLERWLKIVANRPRVLPRCSSCAIGIVLGHTPRESDLAELLGLRMTKINLTTHPPGEKLLTAETTQTIIDWADRKKIATAAESLPEHAKNKL
jgi:hypothetical protein